MSIETTLIELAAQIGNFAGLVAMVMVVWVLRQQSAEAKRQAARDASDEERNRMREVNAAEERRLLIAELVSARRETNEVIAGNTRALTSVTLTLENLVGQIEVHDAHARDAGDNVRAIANKLGLQTRDPGEAV